MWLSTFSLVLTRARISIRTIRTCRMAYLTQFSIPALLNPMINKMADNIAFHMFTWGRGSKWPMIGPCSCSYACAYIDPVFTGQSYDISISTSTRWTNLSIFLVLMLMLMSTQFSLAYTHVLGCLWCASENQALEIGAARRGFACRNRNRIATTIFVFKQKPYPVWFLWPPKSYLLWCVHSLRVLPPFTPLQ